METSMVVKEYDGRYARAVTLEEYNMARAAGSKAVFERKPRYMPGAKTVDGKAHAYQESVNSPPSPVRGGGQPSNAKESTHEDGSNHQKN